MGIRLGAHEFGDHVTAVLEELRETGGRDARVITLEGVIADLDSIAGIEAALDAIAAAASEGEAPLSIRSGRELLVTRTALRREIHRAALTGAFALVLEARDPVERAEEESVVTADFYFSGASTDLEAGGNTIVPLIAYLTPDEEVERPSLSDGTRTLVYDGVLSGGETLTLDGESGRVLLSGEDVTPYTEGELPRLAPGENTLTYAQGTGTGIVMSAELRFRARWW
jgi:hypothetical protein